MTEEEARTWIGERFDASTVERLHTFTAMVIEENDRQNLISPASIESIWARHVADSLQLLTYAPARGSWLDIGTGGGFPGFVIGIVRPERTILVEPRRKRAEFLTESASRLGLRNIQVEATKIERTVASASVISARAVSNIENLLRASLHCATPETRWLLPRGSIDQAELRSVAAAHRLMFHVEQSVTHGGSSIVIMEAR